MRVGHGYCNAQEPAIEGQTRSGQRAHDLTRSHREARRAKRDPTRLGLRRSLDIIPPRRGKGSLLNGVLSWAKLPFSYLSQAPVPPPV
jgi:hypothetical protein